MGFCDKVDWCISLYFRLRVNHISFWEVDLLISICIEERFDFFFLCFSLFSINTVYYMAPFATMILGIPALLLEGSGILSWFEAHPAPWSALIIIFSSGVLAFCLNFSIFYVIHSTTAVTFNVAGNLKVTKTSLNPQLILSFKSLWMIQTNRRIGTFNSFYWQ